MEPTFRLQFLGIVQIEQDDEPVRGFESRKALALLGYLAVQGRPIPREQLVYLFWCDKSESRGRANLSWVLNKISTLLPGCVQADRHTVQFRRAPSYWLDIDDFEQLEARRDPDSLAAAVALYRGEFLEGLSLDGCAEFEIWLVGERERWRQRVIQVLGELITHHGQRGQYQEGLQLAQRLLALEPWRESTHRQVMRLLAYSGQRGAALAQYESCCRVLAEELGVEPSEETTHLYELIRDGEWEMKRKDRRDVLVAFPPFLTGEEPVEVERSLFVAREPELAQLQGFLDAALAGQGRVVFVIGDAGSGKTALVQQFAWDAQAAYPDLVVVSGNGNAHTGIGDPYLPFREILALLTGDVEARLAAGAMARVQARRLWHTLPLAAQALVEAGPDLVNTLLPGVALVERARASVPDEADWLPRLEELAKHRAALAGNPNLQQNALFEQYTRVVEALASDRPLLLILEDLQWTDTGSASLLFHLGRRIEGTKVLVVGIFRPEEVALGRRGERHPLEPVVNELQRHFGDIVVDLGQSDGQRFVDALLDAVPNRLGTAFRETLYRQTRGHSLFTAELLRDMRERGDLVQDQAGRWVEGPSLNWQTLPVRVEAVIAERIGRLAEPSREALRVASVEGETFTAEVVAQVRAADEQEMMGHLSGELDRKHRLVSARGVLRRDGQHLSLYRFRHILFQKYLYSSLDRVERAHLHQAVGTALEALYKRKTGEIAAIAPQLARHFQEAGIAEKAIDYLQRAGEGAVQMSAHEEAIVHYTQGLALLETLPDSPERAQQELALQIGLGVALQATRGLAVPEVGRTFGRAQELCRQMGETPQLFPVLGLLITFYGTRGEHETAHEVAEQFLSLAERANDPLLVAMAHWMVGWNCVPRGKLTEVEPHLEHLFALYDPQQHGSLAFHYGLDPAVVSLSALSWALWGLGYPEQALERSREALSLARELSHSPSLALAQVYASMLRALGRDWQRAEGLADACINLSTEQGFPYWLSGGLYCRGWALAGQGRAEEGAVQIRQGLATNRNTGAEAYVVFQLAALAEAYGEAGQVEEGLAAVAEALVMVDRTGERYYEAEVHRLKGELLRMQTADETDVEACFQHAIEVARQQQAKSWELRAVMSLCRLWQEQGKRKEARQILAETYGWFTEGFDTLDLQEARSLLEALS